MAKLWETTERLIYMALQHNSSAEHLRSFVERLERLSEDMKATKDDAKLVMTEATGSGFDAGGIKAVLKIRAMKPHDYQEAEAIKETYLHALGMSVEPPLFRAAGLAEFDPTVRENVLSAMRAFVPAFGKGDIIVTWGGKKLRLLRDKDGGIVEQDVVDAPAPSRGTTTEAKPRPPKADVPDVDADGAKALGREYAKDNKAVVANPFPYGDPRRAKFDEGWREGAGSDGMGPPEE